MINLAKVLKFAEHAFNDVALLVHVPVTASLRLALGGITATLPEPVEQFVASYPCQPAERRCLCLA